MTEGRRLRRIGRTDMDPVKLQQAIMVLMSTHGQSALDIAYPLDRSPEYVRAVIHTFQRVQTRRTAPKMERSRPKTVSEQGQRRACLIALVLPRDLGLAFST
jgi:transposase